MVEDEERRSGGRDTHMQRVCGFGIVISVQLLSCWDSDIMA